MRINSKRITADFDVTIPQEGLYDSDGFDLGRHVNNLRQQDKERQAAEAQEREIQDLRTKYANVINDIQNSDDPIQTAFELLVPSSGPADSQAGELVRAMMRLLYRDFNDGDVFYEGYGLETCADAAQYLCNEIGDPIIDIVLTTANKQATGSEYTRALEEMSGIVIDTLMDNPQLFDTPNDGDYRCTDISDIKDLEPKYELDIAFSDSVQAHLDCDDISSRDIQWEVESWLHNMQCEDAYVDVFDQYVVINDLNRDAYDELARTGGSYFESYGDMLDEEYGSPYDEDEEDEEDY
jgi:hypothetical protein